jgi:hypothetical protein
MCLALLVANIFVVNTKYAQAQYRQYPMMRHMIVPLAGPPSGTNGEQDLGNGFKIIWHTSAASSGVNWSVAQCPNGFEPIAGGFENTHVSSTGPAAVISTPDKSFTGWFTQSNSANVPPTAFVTCAPN